MSISKRTAHQSLNRLQVIVGQLELALLEKSPERMTAYITKAEEELQALSTYLREQAEP